MSGRKCEHAITADKYGETTHDHNGAIMYEVEYRECLDCGEWLSLGPARDTPEVIVEVDAADIAANYRDEKYTPGDDRFDWCPEHEDRALCKQCETLYLVWCIARHEIINAREIAEGGE